MMENTIVTKNERIEWLEMELERVKELESIKQERIERMAVALNTSLKKQRDLRFKLLKRTCLTGIQDRVSLLDKAENRIAELEKELKNREDALDKLFKVAEEIFYG